MNRTTLAHYWIIYRKLMRKKLGFSYSFTHLHKKCGSRNIERIEREVKIEEKKEDRSEEKK